jgi:hypothetical protein
VIDEETLESISKTLASFHQNREIFREVGVQPEGFSLPRQHALSHYPVLIQMFGAPNGLCSSITESMHIRAVKRAYRRSSRNNPLGQMLIINQRMAKLAAAHVDFASCGMLDGSGVSVDPSADMEQALANASAITSPGDNDLHAIDGPKSLSEVKLAKTPGMFLY